MFGSIGGPEILFIFVVALLVFGPRRLPEIGKKIGGVVRELRRATGDFRDSMEREIGFDPVKGVEQARRARRDILTTVSDPIRDVATGTVALARDAKDEASRMFKGGWVERESPQPEAPGARKAPLKPEPAQGAAADPLATGNSGADAASDASTAPLVDLFSAAASKAHGGTSTSAPPGTATKAADSPASGPAPEASPGADRPDSTDEEDAPPGREPEPSERGPAG